MNIMVFIAVAAFIAFIISSVGVVVLWRKYGKLISESKRNESEFAQKVYEAEVLRGISEQIGYALDAVKIIEIISSSLDKLMPYNVISYLVDPGVRGQKIKFWCKVKEAVGPGYIADIKQKMMMAYAEMTGNMILETDVEDGVSGGLIDNKVPGKMASFFNLPVLVSGKVVAIVNISSLKPKLYDDKNTEVLYRMISQVSETASRLQDLIKNEKGKLTQALESLSDGVIMVDDNMQLVLANSQIKKMLGLSQDPAILDVFGKLEGQLDLRTMVETATKSTSQLEKKEIQIGDKVLEVMARRVVNQKGSQAIGVVVTFYDATDTKNLERLRSEFMALMVHELRAPLTTIKSTVDYISEEGLKTFKEDEIEHHFQVIRSTSQAMLELVSDLLDVAKIEANKFDVICEPGDIMEMLNAEVESFRPLAIEKGLKLEAKFDADLPTVNYDRVRMKQVLNNLISNAIKYTDAGGITISAVREVVNGHTVDVKVSVTDTGIGIEQEEADKLFAKFSQLKNGRNQAGLKSTGLGLFISKGIIEASGGKIWAESAGPGLGTTFCFTVPIARGEHIRANEEDQKIIFSTKRVAQA